MRVTVINAGVSEDVMLSDLPAKVHGRMLMFEYRKDNGEASTREGTFERVQGEAICIRESKGYRSFKVANIRGFRINVS